MYFMELLLNHSTYMKVFMERESLGSRLGFLLLAAGCAIGLGNVWRFPFITGENGGGAFVLLYLIFLAILGVPVLVMELSLGRASRRNYVGAFTDLANSKPKVWRSFATVFYSGTLLLMMFYTTVSGWLIYYTSSYVTGSISACKSSEQIGTFFTDLLQNPGMMSICMLAGVVASGIICSIGLQKGVERIVKWMMGLLFILLIVLCVRGLMLPGAGEGMKFYLLPDFSKFSGDNIGKVIYAALGQAFFTLSIGIGSMEIFGSYIDKKHTLLKEAFLIVVLDTLIALFAGVLIFSVCFSYKVDVSGGPGLIFVSLPNIFKDMAGGRIWGAIFFFFLTLAAMTTLIAVFEAMIAYLMDEFKFKRFTASLAVTLAVGILSLPCVFGFNFWSGFQPFGKGSTVLDLEDFIVSMNLLPLGSLMIVVFCTWKFGWGWKNAVEEINQGAGVKFPCKSYFYMKYILPLIIGIVFVMGYISMFFK